jgi:hypothetical protein
MEVDCVTLSSVLGNVGMDEIDDIRSNTGAEDSGKNNVIACALNNCFSFTFVGVVDMDDLSVDHG